jgi:Ca2+-binding EF-hand superfamily protein
MINKENLRFAFHHYDSDNDGFISAANLIEAFHREGRNISEDEVYKMIEDFGVSKEAKLTFE